MVSEPSFLNVPPTETTMSVAKEARCNELLDKIMAELEARIVEQEWKMDEIKTIFKSCKTGVESQLTDQLVNVVGSATTPISTTNAISTAVNKVSAVASLFQVQTVMSP